MINLDETDFEVTRNTALFSSVSEESLKDLLADASVRSWDRGETIFLQGDPASAFFIVLDGWIKVYRMTPGGEEAVLGVFTKGQAFAEAAAFTGKSFPASSEAVTDCRVLIFRANSLRTRIYDSPDIGMAMLASVSQHLHELVQQVEALKAHTGAQRVAEFLVSLCQVEKGDCTIHLPYDKALIAGRLGMKPESLSRAFVRLRDEGVRINQNTAEINDVASLRDFVDQERALVMRHAPHPN